MSSHAAVAAAAAILCTSLTTCVLCEEGCPQGHVGVDYAICYGTFNCIVSVIEGPKAVIIEKRSLREFAGETLDTTVLRSCNGGNQDGYIRGSTRARGLRNEGKSATTNDRPSVMLQFSGRNHTNLTRVFPV